MALPFPEPLHVAPIGTPSPASVFARLRERPGAAWLDSGDRGDWSILVWDPVEVVTDPGAWPEAGRRLTRRSEADVPFAGGVLGLLGFGAGAAVEAVPAEARAWEPTVHLARYEGALCFNHRSGRWHAVGRPSVRAEGRGHLEAARPLPAPSVPGQPDVFTVPRQVWEDDVRRVQALIAEGDVYQINLTRPVLVADAGDAWQAWQRLRARSRPGRGAWMTLPGGVQVLSNSPEVFLDVDGRTARTVPIKGTRPRGDDDVQIAALEGSEKDRAELTMIVDLCRNDLGRVAVPGSVTTAPRRITTHANVHHAAQVVTATLAEGRDAWSALAAAFPPGSVTGAPKVRACQRIAALEPGPRGAYCGAIGFVSDSGIARWSVAIRTAVFRGSHARYHVGAGIVADSDPSAEWDETVDKGSMLARALTGRARPCDTARPLAEAPSAFAPWMPQ